MAKLSTKLSTDKQKWSTIIINYRISKHCFEMWRNGKKRNKLKYYSVYYAVNVIGWRNENYKHDNILSVANQRPRNYCTDKTTDILDQPYAVTLQPSWAERPTGWVTVYDPDTIIIVETLTNFTDCPNYNTCIWWLLRLPIDKFTKINWDKLNSIKMKDLFLTDT